MATQAASTAPVSHRPDAPLESYPAQLSAPSASTHDTVRDTTQPPTRIDEGAEIPTRARGEISSEVTPQPSIPAVVVRNRQAEPLPAPVDTRAQAETRSQSAQISVPSNDSGHQARQLQSTAAPSRSFIRSISAPNLVRRDTAELASPLPDLSLYTLLDAADFLPQVGAKSIDKGKKRAIDVVDVSSDSEEDGGDVAEDGDEESESGESGGMRGRGEETEDEACRDLNVAVAGLDGEETESYNEDEEDSDTGSERSALRSSQRTSPSKRGRPSQGGEASTRKRGRPIGSGRGRGGKIRGQFSGRTILGFYSSNRQQTPMSTESRQTSHCTENRPTYASLDVPTRRGSSPSFTRLQRSSSLSLARASPNICDDGDMSPHVSVFESPSTSFSAHPGEDHTLPFRHRTQAAPPPTPSPSQLSTTFDDKKVKTLRRMHEEATTMRSVADQMRDLWIDFQNAYDRYTQDHVSLGQETSGCQGRIAEHVHFHVGLSSDVHLFAAAMQRALDDGADAPPKLRFKGVARRERDG
ncbi:ubiquitin carboxyl-terminal hydrolase [Pseudozyma hubeiensis SY62]|uniref:Ubiquitin carboxyl-terminal hydrolase n=1 Tax=Pseudozyma hubeiensis (strain SY62) TaxID=1305764 RepID=R9P417_PSEHS|nr:ubiquitin carboxyl-terminal hydrolase [Pseudozyma hubeiensis SY62]GAC96044.1 ubiquitin carboxyl-terminal hydrolase [Pseudozyma hubeiensis SY62]